MKKNNSRKPFFNEEKRDSDSPKRNDFSSKSQKFNKTENKSDFQSNSFGKKVNVQDKMSSRNKSEGIPLFSDNKPKGRFFKDDEKGFGKTKFPYKKRNESESDGRNPYGEKGFDKFPKEYKKWESEPGRPFPKKQFDESPNSFQKGGGFSGKKVVTKKSEEQKPYYDAYEQSSKVGFEKGKFSRSSKSNLEKPYKKDYSAEKSGIEKGEKLVYKGRGKDQKPIYGVDEKPFSQEQISEKRGFGKNRPKKVELNPDRPDYNLENLPQKKIVNDTSDLIRLNKYISNSGICSRREADELIIKGMVTVNGEVVREMGHKVKKTDRVVFEGKRINPEKPVYVLLNKPKDFITTTEDPMERKTVMNLVANACEERIFPVGRLDRNTTGLLLFTNDGELAAKLSHPSNEIKKIYQVTLDKSLTHKDEEAILEGLTLEDGDVKVDDMQVLSKDRSILGLEIHVGRNRIVRRIFAHLGYEVIGLDRVMYAGLDKKDLKRGRYRFLTEQEVIRLKYYT
jgi:23S rRNA pseudouridine2605 synthase